MSWSSPDPAAQLRRLGLTACLSWNGTVSRPFRGTRIRVRDLWVMSRHAAVSHRLTYTLTSQVTSPPAPPSHQSRPVSPRGDPGIGRGGGGIWVNSMQEDGKNGSCQEELIKNHYFRPRNDGHNEHYSSIQVQVATTAMTKCSLSARSLGSIYARHTFTR